MASEAQLEDAYSTGRRAWPNLNVDYERFRGAALDVGASGEGLETWAGDFFLSVAAGVGDQRAVVAIEERIIARLPARILRLGTTADRVDDVLQTVRARLFAGPAPRIRAYNAAAPLEQWIKVVAVRTAIDLHRREASQPKPSASWTDAILQSEGPDPALAVMKEQYRQEFEAALRTHLAALSVRDRTVLRLHVVEGLSIEKIAASYGVHRVTVARWIWNLGEVVLNGLRKQFEDRFGIVTSEFDSLARLLRSQISVNIAEVLGGESERASSQ